MIDEDDEQNAYGLTYAIVRMLGNHQQAHRWACFARDNWKYANAIKRGYPLGRKFLDCAHLHYDAQNIYQVLVKEGLEPNPEPEPVPHGQAPMAQLHGPFPHGPAPIAQLHGPVPHGPAPIAQLHGPVHGQTQIEEGQEEDEDADLRGKFPDEDE